MNKFVEMNIPLEIEKKLRRLYDKKDKLTKEEYEKRFGEILASNEEVANKLLEEIANDRN